MRVLIRLLLHIRHQHLIGVWLGEDQRIDTIKMHA